MKKIILILVAAFMSFAAMAFDFTGKTFKGTAPGNNGNNVTVTAKFRPNNRMTMLYTGKGYGTKTDSNMFWEVSGDFINVCDSSGDIQFFNIDTDNNGNIVLQLRDDYGNPYLTLKQVTATAGKSTGAAKGKTKRRK